MNPPSKTIVIVVTPDGQTTVETHGFQGSSCREASQFIERALGRSTSEALTSEFHQSQDVTQPLQQRK